MNNPAPPLTGEEFARSFAEIHPPFESRAAVVEANRCLYCFDAPCAGACPTHIDVPRFIKKISTGNLRGSAGAILEANIFQRHVLLGPVTDVAARVTMTQRYRNREPKPVEAVYVFPLDEQAAVCGFEVIVNGTHFVGDVRTREEAFKRYDDALSEGHGAYLLDEETPDVFTANVGNIPPGAFIPETP
jgi:hypothetical protein